MKIFIDSADLDEIRQGYAWGVVDGVTTNPSLLKKAVEKRVKSGEKLDLKEYITRILEEARGTPVSLEVTEYTAEKMVEQAKRLYDIFNPVAGNVYVKIPVNVLFSYLTSKSVGVELDDWTLEEYPGLRRELDGVLAGEGLPTPPGNIFLFQGDTMEPALHERIHQETGLGFSDFDLFYTYLAMHEEFAGLINRKARKGAFFLVYGLDKVFPRFEGLRLLTTGEPLEGILGIYQKE